MDGKTEIAFSTSGRYLMTATARCSSHIRSRSFRRSTTLARHVLGSKSLRLNGARPVSIGVTPSVRVAASRSPRFERGPCRFSSCPQRGYVGRRAPAATSLPPVPLTGRWIPKTPRFAQRPRRPARRRLISLPPRYGSRPDITSRSSVCTPRGRVEGIAPSAARRTSWCSAATSASAWPASAAPAPHRPPARRPRGERAGHGLQGAVLASPRSIAEAASVGRFNTRTLEIWRMNGSR